MRSHLYVILSSMVAHQVLSIPEEYYQPSLTGGMGFGPASLNSVNEDDEGPIYTYLDIRSGMENQEKPEARRRSILDKNFARFGRGDSMPGFNYDYDMDYGMANFARPTRSGNDKTDHFIRFGRRDRDGPAEPRYKMSRVLRNKDSFMRFGRNGNIKVAKSALRSKRSVYDHYYNKRKTSGSDFVRFGRGRNDEFMRFGRDKVDESKSEHGNFTRPLSTSSTEDYIVRNNYLLASPLLQLLKELSMKLNHRGETGSI